VKYLPVLMICPLKAKKKKKIKNALFSATYKGVVLARGMLLMEE
jgi:hypothetical protein